MDFREPKYNFRYCAHTTVLFNRLGCLYRSLSLANLRKCFLQSRCLYVIVFFTLAETYWLTIANYCRHSGDGAHSEWKPYFVYWLSFRVCERSLILLALPHVK